MIGAASVKTASKAGGPVLTALVAGLPFDPWWLFAVPVGVFFGSAMRIAGMVLELRDGASIRRELLVSGLAFGALCIAAAVLIEWQGLSLIQGMGVAAALGFLGYRLFDAIAREITAPGLLGRLAAAWKALRESGKDGK